MTNRISAVVAVFVCCASTAAFAANPACDAQAAEKKLSGAVKTSFVKKREKEAAEAASKTMRRTGCRQEVGGCREEQLRQE